MLAFIWSLIAVITFWLQAGFATLSKAPDWKFYKACVTFFIISGIFAILSIYHGILISETETEGKKKAYGVMAKWMGILIFLGLVASWIYYGGPKFG